MIVIFLSSFLAVYLSFLSSRIPRKNRLFELGFIIITIVAAIRWNYASDYMGYYDDFITEYHFNGFWSSLSAELLKEPGWAILNHFFPSTPLGFVCLTALISIFQNYVYYIFIKENVPPRHRWLAMTIYLFSTSFWLMNMSMLRQGLTITLFVLASKYIADKKVFPSIIIILIACTIHRTAFLLLPFLLLCFVPFNKGKLLSVILVGVFFVIYYEKDTLDNIVNLAFSFEKLEGYSHYIEDSDSGSFGMGALINTIPYIVMLFFLFTNFNNYNNGNKLILLLTLVSFCLLPLEISNGAFTRITTYFTVFKIVSIPVIYSQISNKPLRIVLTSIFLLMLFFQYYLFLFVTDWSSVAWRNYHTMFELF